MEIRLNPEARRFILGQVESGRFASAVALLVEAEHLRQAKPAALRQAL